MMNKIVNGVTVIVIAMLVSSCSGMLDVPGNERTPG